MANVRLAYLTSQYPATSHTFIRREIATLREQGVAIDSFSVRAPAQAELVADADQAEAARTFYILRQGVVAVLAANLAMVFTRPLAYLGTFALALRHRPPGMRGLLLSIAHFAESMVLARELRRRRLTHLHNHFANSAATVGLLASRMLGMGWSFTMHGISETDYPAGLLLAEKVRAADMVVCVSWFGRAQAMRLVDPAHWGKLHVVRCGLPLSAFPARETRDTAPKTILCVGRLSPEKGQAGLLEVFARLRGKIPDAELRLVGDGPGRNSLERLARVLHVDDAVTFAGRLTEDATLAEIARADVLALPSFMEGLPIVLMEAMALGVPVIASRVAGIPELVEDGRNGLLFTPSNWDELGGCIQRLLSDRELYERLSAAARMTIAAEFDSLESARQLVELFRESAQRPVLSQSRGAPLRPSPR
jgi:glycosyltransferase involved in cell wall biosynthesis